MPNVTSKNVKSVEHDGATNTLRVVFHKSPNTYAYKDVPREVYVEMLAAPSIGAFVHERLKDRYAYEME